MSNAGHDNNPVQDVPEPHDDERGVPWWLIGVGAALLVGAIVIGLRVSGVLTGLLFPPEPPVPTEAELIQHTAIAHGVDDWQYHRPPAACATVTYYEAEGGTCTIQPGYCTDDPNAELQQESALAATCTGEVAFSVFVMGWEAEIYDYSDYTRILLSRDIPWSRTTDGE